ncbi:hypothetical protein [Mucilaginibacter sp. UR6-11]|uniref:hypothetical protein n=1 Tax=Mucilaginibacter sp. UR6-11 TaxID=1435644 RepID=UPI001E357B4D|nr:hypothetical protein [Mucilaginibacter sp. UR6-11]MCC8427253.1 hypothetical protein [Mucilaginibacter sp. UR6-11]
MKKIYIILVATFAIPHFSYAQWNPVTGGIAYNAGYVGIGTTNPSVTLDVVGRQSNFGVIPVNIGGSGSGYPGISYNVNYQSAANTYNYKANDVAYFIGLGGLIGNRIAFNVNTGGTAGNPITFNEAMSILNTGNVGIGTISPSFKLDVGNTINVTASSSSGIAYQFDGTAYGGKKWAMGDGTTVNGTFAIRDITDSKDFLSIVGSSGNIGIGTTNPGRKLDILAGAGVTPLAAVGANGYLLVDNVGSGQSFYQANAFHQFQGTSGNPIMTLFSNGNVGIGTTQPDAKLTVNGTIHSTEVKVTATVPPPDYVFEPAYKLPKLTELKTYLDDNHHLPEIPSAADIEKNGINLSEMNLKLLKKVEELTLYLIEQSKQLANQQKINQSLQEQINKLTNKK